MGPDPKTPSPPAQVQSTLLACDRCEVTWRETPGSLCWLCERPGYVVSPERLVVEL